MTVLEGKFQHFAIEAESGTSAERSENHSISWRLNSARKLFGYFSQNSLSGSCTDRKTNISIDIIFYASKICIIRK